MQESIRSAIRSMLSVRENWLRLAHVRAFAFEQVFAEAVMRGSMAQYTGYL